MSNHSIKSKKHHPALQVINLMGNSTSFYGFKNLKTTVKALIARFAVAKDHCKDWKALKRYSLIAVVVAAMFITSCKKEALDGTVLNSTTSGNSSAQAKTGWPFSHKGDGGSSNTPPGKYPGTNYGATIGTPDGTDDESFQLNVADQLGISCLRERVSVPIVSLGNNLVPELNTSYNVLLNFCSPNSGNQLIPFVTDLDQYKTNLNNILDAFTVMPLVAVIENEESNRYFYSGTASQYISQLSTAIGVMHARGIKVTNGGITSTGLNYLVYQDFLDQHKYDSAQLFKQLTNVTPNNPYTLDRGAFVDILLDSYADMDLDYVNFHWKGTSPNTDALNEVINYIKKRTRKDIISNELGQFDTDPNTLLALVDLCTNRNFPFIIWYSPDENSNRRDTPLQYEDGSLTPTGVAYRNYLED